MTAPTPDTELVAALEAKVRRLTAERDEARRQETLCRHDGNVQINLRRAAEDALKAKDAENEPLKDTCDAFLERAAEEARKRGRAEMVASGRVAGLEGLLKRCRVALCDSPWEAQLVSDIDAALPNVLSKGVCKELCADCEVSDGECFYAALTPKPQEGGNVG